MRTYSDLIVSSLARYDRHWTRPERLQRVKNFRVNFTL